MLRRRDLVDERMERAQRALAKFDSAAVMLRALACHLEGRHLKNLGALPRVPPIVLEPAARVVNALPDVVREQLYSITGAWEAVSEEDLDALDAEDVAAWMTSRYPPREFPAAAIGSANGALLHLCAALDIPWLPQTFLVPVRARGLDVDDARGPLEWARPRARRVLEKNPELDLYHMRDPNQDRLMLRRMTYFRFKRRRLGEAFTRFLQERVAPGGTLFVFDCRRTWPTTRVDDRHVLQFGALGGADERDYFEGSPRVERYLSRYRASRTRWDPPPPDGRTPEAEWGFEPALLDDVERVARRRGLRVVRVVFLEPEDPSPFVADLYRLWLRENGLPGAQLLVESFVLLEPRSAIRTASVPFWMKFNKEPSLRALERYLDEAPPYDYLLLTLFSHGVDSVGLVPIATWRDVLRRARVRGRFIGVDARAYPRDFGIYGRFSRALARIHPRFPMPPPMSLGFLEAFLEDSERKYAVRFERATPPSVDLHP